MHHTTRSYLIPISIGTLLSLGALASILFFIDPTQSGWASHILFFVTLFLSLCGILTLGGIIVRKRLSPGMFTEQLRISFRQAVLLAILIVGLLIIQLFNLLFWWVGLTLVLFIITVEIFLNA